MKKFIFKSVFMLMISISFFSCSSDSDKDEPITCPIGFTGTNCTTKITPTRIKITSVDITNYPVVDYDNGSIAWDPNESGNAMRPDVFFALYQNGNYTYVHSSVFADADPNLGHTFTLDTPIIVNSLNAPIIFELRDYNQSNNTYDLMGSTLPDFIYNPSDLNFPSTITLTNTNEHTEAVLHLSYEW